jgi:hypothetical protein
MKYRRVAAVLVSLNLLAGVASSAAAAPWKKQSVMAPDSVPSNVALFLAAMSADGNRRISLRATALGTHFFIEEAAGVTVYTYDGNGGYRKETFLKGSTLEKAAKKYEPGRAGK